MVIVLSPKYSFKLPVYAESLSPDFLVGKSLEEISALSVWEGNKNKALKELFDIKGEAENSPEKIEMCMNGNLKKVRMVGSGMSFGKIIVTNDIGMRLGQMMKGGEIVVDGNVDSWVGAMMKGGRIEIKGSAGDYVGAPYRGSTEGMKAGIIIIHGNAGSEIGCFMKGGLIKVVGNVGGFPGVHMRDGTILIQGDCEDRAGAGMINGKIIICGHVPSVLPTFTIDGIRSDVKIDSEKIIGPFYRFSGDIADNGEGKLFIAKVKNSHLSAYEKYL